MTDIERKKNKFQLIWYENNFRTFLSPELYAQQIYSVLFMIKKSPCCTPQQFSVDEINEKESRPLSEYYLFAQFTENQEFFFVNLTERTVHGLSNTAQDIYKWPSWVEERILRCLIYKWFSIKFLNVLKCCWTAVNVRTRDWLSTGRIPIAIHLIIFQSVVEN